MLDDDEQGSKRVGSRSWDEITISRGPSVKRGARAQGSGGGVSGLFLFFPPSFHLFWAVVAKHMERDASFAIYDGYEISRATPCGRRRPRWHDLKLWRLLL